MATIGLDKLYYAKITEGDNGNETYGTPTQLAKAMTAELSVELAEATLYADDGAAEVVKEFQSGTLTLGIDDIGSNDINEVSGGQLQRACICRSMINDPKMIFAEISEVEKEYPIPAAFQAYAEQIQMRLGQDKYR